MKNKENKIFRATHFFVDNSDSEEYYADSVAEECARHKKANFHYILTPYPAVRGDRFARNYLAAVHRQAPGRAAFPTIQYLDQATAGQ